MEKFMRTTMMRVIKGFAAILGFTIMGAVVFGGALTLPAPFFYLLGYTVPLSMVVFGTAAWLVICFIVGQSLG